jgi:hypothetical protein
MKKYLLSTWLLFALLLTACQPSAEQIKKAIEQTQVAGKEAQAVEVTATETAKPKPTARPTKTATPVRTKAPTRTPKPTNTTRPTNTETAIPQPVTLEGSGNQVVDFDNLFGIGFIHVTHEGSSNFVVKNYGANNEKIDLLVNTIGDYDGYRTLDFGSDDHTVRFQVEADGDWKIIVYPLDAEYLKVCDIPGTCKGKGDDLFAVKGKGRPDVLTFTDKSDSNVIVYAYTKSGRDLLVNEIGPYSGSSLFPANTILVEVRSEGEWTAEITIR